MSRKLISVLATSAFFLVSGGALAQTPSNTGTTGAVDANWQVSTDGGSSWLQAFRVINPLFPGSGFIPPNWEPNTSSYAWISATATGSGGGGNYLFRTFFDLTGLYASSISFNCVVDNLPPTAQYSLNGGAFGGSCGYQDLYDFTGTQTIGSGFVSGVNELMFRVTGDSQTDGLLVGNMALVASTVPEPGSIILLATGLIGVFGAAAHRRRRSMRGA